MKMYINRTMMLWGNYELYMLCEWSEKKLKRFNNKSYKFIFAKCTISYESGMTVLKPFFNLRYFLSRINFSIPQEMAHK